MNFKDFVDRTIAEISEFDHRNPDCIQELVRKAIVFYNLKSYEAVENNGSGMRSYIHVYSMMEENLLSKIVGIVMDDDLNHNIESAYEGFVIREY